MADLRLAICQIPLTITLDPIRIANLDSHIHCVQWCIAKADEYHADSIIFPEYTYCEELRPLYEAASISRTIIGGSYQSPDNFNVTAVAIDGTLTFHKKVKLSPYENSVGLLNPVLSGDPNLPVFSDFSGITVSVLTCFDYYINAHHVGTQAEIENRLVDVIVSPCCNDNKELILSTANTLHFHRDMLYSVICNVAHLNIKHPDNSITAFPNMGGGSAVFGVGDKVSRDILSAIGRRDVTYGNNLLKVPDGPNVALITIDVPYAIHRMSTMEFRQNPSDVDVTIIPPFS